MNDPKFLGKKSGLKPNIKRKKKNNYRNNCKTTNIVYLINKNQENIKKFSMIN